WLRVLREAFGYQLVNLACEDATGQLRGILPLCHQRGLFTGRRFSSLPRTPVAGPLAYDNHARTLLLRAALERVREAPGAQLHCKVLVPAPEGSVEGLVGRPWRSTYVLELPERPELLHLGDSRNHARIRWAVNKAARLGVHVRPAETEHELRAWYRLYLD